MATRKSAGSPSRRVTGKCDSPRKNSGNRSKPASRTHDRPAEPGLRGDVPLWLARSPIFQRVPARQRARLDRAILLPGSGGCSIPEIAEKFKLIEKYAITPAMLATYARKLEQLMRPTVTSQVMAGVLSCLPEAYRRRLIRGSEVLLVSKVLAALNTSKTPLTVAEMAKLASILMSVAKQNRSPTRRSDRQAEQGSGLTACDRAEAADPAKMAESIRMLYGLDWPPDSAP